MTEVFYWSADAYCTWMGLSVPAGAQWEKATEVQMGRFPWGEEEADCEFIIMV